jgi:urea transport system permease protein
MSRGARGLSGCRSPSSFCSLILPTLLSRYALLNVNSFLLMAPLAAGLALLWGYGGVLSHGQSAFFGLGGYAYGIVAINLASTRWASLAGLGVGLVAAVSQRSWCVRMWHGVSSRSKRRR